MAAVFPEITSDGLAQLDELLLRVGEMQASNVWADEILSDLADGMEPADLADARHELATIARALRSLTRIGEAHNAQLREATDD